MKKVDYIIFFEHAARELESVKKLKVYLDSMGYYGVILPEAYNRYLNVLKYKPKIVVLPYLYYKEGSNYLHYLKMYSSIIAVNLHSEQIGNEITAKSLLPYDEISRDVFHVCWGKNFAAKLIESGVRPEKIFITGSIRNDLLFKYKKSDPFKNDVILIPTSFSAAFKDDFYINDFINLIHNSRHINKNDFLDLINFVKKSRDAFFKIIYETSRAITDKIFVLRPHPAVDVKIYRDYFLRINNISALPGNIIVERKGGIHEAMAKCYMAVCFDSTSIIDAVLMNKNAVILEPYKFPPDMEMDFMKYLPRVKDKDELMNIINNYTMDKKRLKRYLLDNYYQVDGKSTLRVAHIIDNLMKKTNIRQRLSVSYSLKMIFKALQVDLIKNILYKTKLLDKVIKFYEGLLEDNITIKGNFYSRDVADEIKSGIIYKKSKWGLYVD